MPLLMIPGPIEVSPAVVGAGNGPPVAHLAPTFIEAFGRSLELMREVWMAGPEAQPFILAGSGTIAMELAVANVVDGGDRVVVVQTGYFSDRIAEMARRRGADVVVVEAEPGDAPSLDEVGAALAEAKTKALLVTHVDTSTGVRADVQGLAKLAKAHGALSVFDGVCATAAEETRMAEWGCDVVLTASQKAVGLPAGLALLVASPAALAARDALELPPPMSLDWHEHRPIMRAYEARERSYFSTPATTLVAALPVGLAETLAGGMDACFARHRETADAFRRAWAAMGLSLVPRRPELAANTLSAVRFPAGVTSAMVGSVGKRGVVIAGGLHPAMKTEYFRVGHMGHVLSRPEELHRTVRAIGEALGEHGHAVDVDAALAAFDAG